jgi:hypothetical protein
MLFSYELIGDAPVIDGSLISSDGDPGFPDNMGEWKVASSRTLMLSDSGTAQIFLANSPETLFVGLTYLHGNNSDGSGIVAYFEEGPNAPPAALDGPGDMLLFEPNGLNNEQGSAVAKAGGSNAVSDLSWNGSAWVEDGDGAHDFRLARYFYSSEPKVHHTELAIPLNNKIDDANNSDLNVDPYDAIGFFLHVVKMGGGAGNWSWIETNDDVNNPDIFPFWGRIQLSVKREFFTFYTGKGDAPTIDGSIDEAAWAGAYQRDIILSNYHYGALAAHVWCMEDTAQEYIYIGVRVYDNTASSGDYVQVYFEENGANATDSIRDYDLDDGFENSLRIALDDTFSDLYWSTDMGTWVADPEAADGQTAKAGSHSGYIDYEFKVLRSGGAYDVDITDNGLLGFLIRFHDADRTADERGEFYWEFTTNNEGQLLSEHTQPESWVATGWANLQLGGPSIQLTSPVHSEVLDGMVTVTAVIENETPSSVIAYVSTDTANKVTLTDNGSGTWSGTVDVTNMPPGSAYVVLRVEMPDGKVYERIQEVVVHYAGIKDAGGGLLNQFSLAQNQPNPFSRGTAIRFSLPPSAAPENVTIQVYNLACKRVRTLINSPVAGGNYSVNFDGLDDHGKMLPSGMYYYRMTSGRFTATRKMLMLAE